MPTPSQSPTLTAAQFNAVDINKDGKVDYSEANRLYQGQGLTQAQLLAMDLNKDGVITLKEQQAWMAQQAAAGAPMPQVAFVSEHVWITFACALLSIPLAPSATVVERKHSALHLTRCPTSTAPSMFRSRRLYSGL